jgi:hypothetical protein
VRPCFAWACGESQKELNLSFVGPTSKALNQLKAEVREVGLRWRDVEARLPDWAADAAHSEAGRIELGGFIARHFGLRLREGGGFEPLPLPNALFKLHGATSASDVEGARSYATAVAKLVAKGVRTAWSGMPRDPAHFRELALKAAGQRTCLDFESLIEASWQLGIPVIHLPILPVEGRKPDGLVTFVAGRPAIVLAKSHSCYEWLTFILAHELGHVGRSHLNPVEGAAIVDEQVSLSGEITLSDDDGSADMQEQEANAFASAVLMPGGNIRLSTPWPVAAKLAEQAVAYAKPRQLNPVHVLLNAAKFSSTSQRSAYPLCGAAVKILHESLDPRGAVGICRDVARRHLALDDFRPDTAEFLEKLEVV